MRRAATDTVMHYREHAPPASLARHVQCVWELRDEAPGNAIQTIYPDGRCELVAELGVPLRFHGVDGTIRSEHAIVFSGQQLGPIRLQATGRVHCIGIRLNPAASALIAGRRLPSMRDRAPDLGSLDSAFAEALHAAARQYACDESPEQLWDLLRNRCDGFALDPLIERAIDSLDASDGDLRITALAARLHTGLRTLQVRFLDAVGLTPKEYARVRRLQAILRTLDAERAQIADAAARHGYSDQAHATHDVARWTGTTPLKLIRALRGDPDGTDSLRLAASFLRGSSG